MSEQEKNLDLLNVDLREEELQGDSGDELQEEHLRGYTGDEPSEADFANADAGENPAFFDTMRNAAMIGKASFPDQIDFYDPEQDEII